MLDIKYEVVIADTDDRLRDCFRVRYEVYCLEKGYEQVVGDEETDRFDLYSQNILLRNEVGAPIGTARVIPAFPLGLAGLPMARLCAPRLLDHLPGATTAEISRFTIKAAWRTARSRRALIVGLSKISREMGLTHWVSIVEPAMLRLLRSDGIAFAGLGPTVEHRGVRQPATFGLAGWSVPRSWVAPETGQAWLPAVSPTERQSHERSEIRLHDVDGVR